MGDGEYSDGVAIVGIAGLHLNQKPAPLVNQHWNLGGEQTRQWLRWAQCENKVKFAVHCAFQGREAEVISPRRLGQNDLQDMGQAH